jgi:transketolase
MAAQVGGAASQSIEMLAINTIRTLSMDGVQAAVSGHPGTPMALAPTAYCLWQRHLRYNPDDPLWPNRDRFVLSAGHASMLLYSLLHLAGVKAVDSEERVQKELAVPLDEIKRFRQLDSKCPGHPEYRLTTGVETTTGPLGQGVGNSVGMAVAGRWLAAHYNKPGFELFNYNVYAICSDGDLMEGISHEAGSLAGHWKLSNLCWIYDNNHITIEGKTELAFSEEIDLRFKSYGWNVCHVDDANDLAKIDSALEVFKKTKDRPTMIIVRSHIGWGSPNKQDTREAHGEALGEEEVRLTKRNYGWPEDAKFLVPEGVPQHFQQGMGARGRELSEAWGKVYKDYGSKFAEQAKQLEQMKHWQLPEGWDKNLPNFAADAKGKATRDSGGEVLNALAKNIPWLLGGAADLAPSTKTNLKFEGAGEFESGSYGGRNFHFGIREHGMSAIINGMVLCRLRAYGSTFFMFSDYGRNPLRLASIMEIPSVFVYTHDSIGLGEDGPTHQPIEHLASLRAIPGLLTLRPGDANEVVEAWKLIVRLKHEPVALILSRQAVPTLDRSKYAPADGIQRGAYVLADATSGKPDVIIMGTGTELGLCIDAYERLKSEGIAARVVSMPSWEIFEKHCAKNPAYREQVLPSSVTARISVEMASTFGWTRYVGVTGQSLGMTTFGASAPLKDLAKRFGFVPEKVVAAAKEQLALAKKKG